MLKTSGDPGEPARLLDAARNSPLYRSLSNGIHGKPHADRVLLLAGLLAHLAAPRTGPLDWPVLMVAALLHDAGRENDGFDPLHGLRSADLAADWAGKAWPGLNTDLLHQTILLHCPPPGWPLPAESPPESHVLGDADKLERFRLGGRRPLNSDLLALPESLTLVDLAARLNGHPYRLSS